MGAMSTQARPMIREFSSEGIHFSYPENWRLEREDTDEGWTVSVQSPGTAFLMVSLRHDMPTVDQMAETALAALRDDYPDLEADDCADALAGQPAVGHDIHFFKFDLTNTCWTRSFSSPRGTVLVLWQANDLEMEERGPVLRAICASMRLEAD